MTMTYTHVYVSSFTYWRRGIISMKFIELFDDEISVLTYLYLLRGFFNLKKSV